jgi:hypothetical protein
MSSTLSELPIEIFILIRDFLVIVDLSAFIIPEKESLEKFTEEESRRSWRNILALSNSKEWRAIRRETILWSLNRFASERFRCYKLFQKRILNCVHDPVRQLDFNFDSASDENAATLLAGNKCYILKRVGGSDIKLPSSNRIRVLSLSSFPELRELGDYDNLVQLHLADCPAISQSGEMPRLSLLSLSNSAFPMNFPTENLKVLALQGGNIEFLFHYVSNLPQLEELSLHTAITLSHVVKCPFPTLKKVKFQLSADSIGILDISGLFNLRHLEIQLPTPPVIIRGKKKVYPILQTLSTPCDIFLDKNFSLLKNVNSLTVENFPDDKFNINQYFTIPNIKLTSSNGSVLDRKNRNIHLGEKVHSLTLSMGVGKIQGSNPLSHSLLHVHLIKNFYITDLTPFKNVETLQLEHCLQITNIFPLKDIPHLNLVNLPKVKTFSCLGKKRRYLRIVGCSGLSDADIVGFGQVQSLEVDNCSKVTRISGNSKNIQLTVKNCNNLREISLSGLLQTKVSVVNCPLLKIFRWERKIFYLQIELCPTLDQSTLRGSCDYLNGKESSFQREKVVEWAYDYLLPILNIILSFCAILYVLYIRSLTEQVSQ